jgi:hypothetical protein
MVKYSLVTSREYRPADTLSDSFIERSTRAINSGLANPRDVQSLQNWVNGNGCLSWGETEYLTHCNDLQSLADSQDRAVTRSESLVENALVRMLKYFRNVRPVRFSTKFVSPNLN